MSSSLKYVQGMPVARPIWIKYSTGLSPIAGWYFTYKSGAIVVGCCADIASVLWYLGFERHQPATKGPKIHNKDMDFLTDAAAEVWDTNSDSSEESDTE